jgi:hypothetical protein
MHGLFCSYAPLRKIVRSDRVQIAAIGGVVPHLGYGHERLRPGERLLDFEQPVGGYIAVGMLLPGQTVAVGGEIKAFIGIQS